MIFAINGFCRCDETRMIKMNDVEKLGEVYSVKIPNTKSRNPRSYIIGKDFCSYVKKYLDLRPQNVDTDRLFIRYTKGKCTKQVKKKILLSINN